MKYYDNQIYPIALVLSNDIESVRKEYWLYGEDGCEEIPEQSGTSQATTYHLMRKTDDYTAMAVGIVFNVPITAKLAAHEGFHATYFMMNRLEIPLTNYSDEAWAYLMGWIAECIEDYKTRIE